MKDERMTTNTTDEFLFVGETYSLLAPVPVDYPALLKMAVEALEKLALAADCMAEINNSGICDDELNQAHATLTTIKTALEGR